MEIITWSEAMAEAVTDAYNREMQDVPFCYRIGHRMFAGEVARTKPEHCENISLTHQRQYVAENKGSIDGFIDVGIRPAGPTDDEDDDPDEATGVVRCMWYAPGRREAGKMLLDAAQNHVRQMGVEDIVAYHQEYTYRFYQLTSSYLSIHLGQVEALLAYAGYRRSAGEVFLAMDELNVAAAPSPDTPVTLSVESDIAHNRLGRLSITAWSKNDRVVDWTYAYEGRI